MARLNLTTVAAFARPSASQSNIGTATTLAFAVPLNGAGLLAASATGSNILTVANTSGGTIRLQVLATVTGGNAGIALVDGGFAGGVFLTSETPLANIDSGTNYIIYVQTGAAGRVISVMEMDGTEVHGNTGSATTIPAVGAANGFVRVGQSGTVDGLVCSIDAVAIWNAAQAGAERYTPPTGSEPDLLFYVPFDEGSGTSAANAVSSAEDLDAMNATSWSVGGTWDGAALVAITPTRIDAAAQIRQPVLLEGAAAGVIQPARIEAAAQVPSPTLFDSAAVVWGALGDSQTDEYRADDDRGAGANAATTLNWLEQLALPNGASGAAAHHRSLDVGAWGTRAEPRRTGFEYAWARSGVTMAGVIADQVAGLAAQITAGDVTHCVLFGTGNEWVNLSPFLVPDIYNSPDGGVTADSGTLVSTLMDNVAAQYASVIDDIIAAGPAGMVVLMPFDYVLFPGVFGDFPDATRRGYVSAAIADLRGQIEAHAAAVNATAGYNIVEVIESDADMLAVWATDDGTHVTVAGVDLTYTSDAPNGEPEFFALAATTGSAHMGSVANGVIANTFIGAANNLPAISLTPFTDQEIRENAGIFLADDIVTPARIEATAAVHAPVVAATPVAVQPGRIEAGAQVPAPIVAATPVAIAPARVEQLTTVRAPMLVEGVPADVVSPARIEASAEVREPAVTEGILGVSLRPTRVESGAQVRTPEVRPGSVTIAVDRIAASAAVLTVDVVATPISLQPDRLEVAAVVHVPAIDEGVAAVTIAPARVEGGATVPAPAVLAGSVTIAPLRIDAAGVVHDPSITLLEVWIVSASRTFSSPGPARAIAAEGPTRTLTGAGPARRFP